MPRLLALLSVILLLVTSCGDLVKESDSSTCNDAIDQRDYATAVNVCTLRKDKAAAYMGLAGYDINNLLDASSKSASAYTAPTSDNGDKLGTDSATARTVLNLLALDPDTISDEATRRTKIQAAKSNLDSASALLHGSLANLSKDELLLDAFALAFASQLGQILIFDNGTVSDNATPSIAVNPGPTYTITCPTTVNTSSSTIQAVLKPVDGHLWSGEQNHYNCNIVKVYLDANPSDAALVAGGSTPTAVTNALCTPLVSLTDYLSRLTDTIALLDLGSGDSTAAISDSQTELNSLLTTLGCPTS